MTQKKQSALNFRTLAFALTVITLTSFNRNAIAQNIDSLRNTLTSKTLADTTRVLILGKLASAYENVSSDSMVIFADEGLAIATKINFETGKGICHQMLGLAYLHLNKYPQSLDNYQQALAIFEKTDSKKREGNVVLSMGDIYFRQDKYNQAIESYNKGIEIYDQMNFPTGKGFALFSIGGIYNDIGSYAEAISYYLKALTAFEKDKHSGGISISLTTIATLYASLGNSAKAIEYINKSLAIDYSKNSKEQNVLNMHNIATVYGSLNDYKKALQFYNKALEIAESMGDDAWTDVTRTDIADVYYHTDQLDSALIKFSDVLKMAEKIGDTDVITAATRGIGRVMIKQGHIREGIQRLLTAYDISKEKNQKQTIFETALDLSNAYEKEGDYARALAYHKIYSDVNDSVFNDKNAKRVQQLQYDYVLNKKETEIALLKKDTLIAEGRSEKQKITLTALFIGIMLLIVITIILYRSRSIEKRSKEAIVKQKEEIQLQASRLESLNRFKDKTFSVLSHDLRSPLGTLTATLMLLDNNIISPDEFTSTKHELNNQLNSVNILLDNLLHWAKNYFQGKMPSKPESTSIYDLASQNIHLLSDIAIAKQIKLVNNITEPVNAFCDPGQIDIVIRNLLSNAIKFTQKGGTVSISATSEHDKVKIVIADNGVGMTQEQLNKIFLATADNSTYGTDGERGIGLGLLLCYEFVISNNGAISVKSEVGAGSTFIMVLPKTPNTPNP